MDLSSYSSERLAKANEIQLKAILQQFKSEHLPIWKFGLFVGYNALSLVGMYYYGVHLRGKRVAPSLKNRDKLTIPNLFRRGITHSIIMIALYTAGLSYVCSNTISFELLRKLTEIKTTYYSFGLRFDPTYQDHLLFSRMRKFDLPESLIEEIRNQLREEQKRLIDNGGLLPETIKKINEAELLYQTRAKQIR